MSEPWWISAIKGFVIINLVLLTFAYTTLLERKALGRMQLRYGPNRAGPYGLLQPIADLVKLVRKESFFPTAAIDIPYILAPVVSAFTALTTDPRLRPSPAAIWPQPMPLSFISMSCGTVIPDVEFAASVCAIIRFPHDV